MLLYMNYFKTEDNKLVAYKIKEDIVTGQQSVTFSRILFFYYKTRKKAERYDLASIHTEVVLIKERELGFITEHIERYYAASKEIEDPIEVFISKLDLDSGSVEDVYCSNESLSEFFAVFDKGFECFKILKENAEVSVRKKKIVKK